MERKIYLRQARDFGQVFGATFGYIKQNFKSFYGTILLYTVPVITLIGAALAYIITNFTSSFSLFGRGGVPDPESFFLFFGIIMLLGLVIQTVFITTVNQHLILNENLPEGEFVKREQIGTTFFGAYWRVLGNTLLLILMTVIAVFIFSLSLGLIVAGISALGVGGAIFGVIVIWAMMLILSPILMFVITSSMFVLQRDNIGIISAMGKVFRYLKDNFWITWAVSFCSYLMVYIMNFICYIPIYIFILVVVFSRAKMSTGLASEEISTTTIIIGAAMFILTVSVILCVTSLYVLMSNFQFSNLEEKKEGKSIIDKINTI